MKNFLVVELAWTSRRKREKRSLKIMKFRLVFIKELIWLCIKFLESFAPLLLALVTTPLVLVGLNCFFSTRRSIIMMTMMMRTNLPAVLC